MSQDHNPQPNYPPQSHDPLLYETPPRKHRKSMVVIAFIGGLFIIIASLLSFQNEKDRTPLFNLLNAFAGAVGGALISIGVTGFINEDPLERIENEISSIKKKYLDTQCSISEELNTLKTHYGTALQEILLAKVSSENKPDHRMKLIELSKKKLYRYFETLDKYGNPEWRMKEIIFTLSPDQKRIKSRIDYKARSYDVQAACIGAHLLYVAEEINDLDQPMIDIYLNLRIDSVINSSGLSIRHPWDPRDSRLIFTHAILSEHFLLDESEWEKNENDYWILKDKTKESELKKAWRQFNGCVRSLMQQN